MALIKLLLIIFSSFAVSALLIFSLRRFSLRNKVLVKVDIPYSGGIAIGLAFIFSCLFGMLFLNVSEPRLAGMVIACSIMLIFGLYDDLMEFSVFNKFTVEIIATTCLIIFGIRTHIAYLGDLLNIVITYLWVIGITNALNHLDVMDGLAGGISLIASLSFFLISLLALNLQIQVLSIALMGAVLGFFVFNYPPAKIYMGNSGSHFLGFSLAAISLMISYSEFGREIALLSPLLILGFPVFDTAFLIIVRMAKGISAFKKSDDHLALRFLSVGFSKRKTLFIMLVFSLLFSCAGVLISQMSNAIGIIILVILAILSLVLSRLFKTANRFARGEAESESSPLGL